VAQLPELEALAALATDLRERGEGVDAERKGFLAAQIDADRAKVAQGMGGAKGLEAELAALNFAAVAQRLEQLESTLATEDARSLVHKLADDNRRARAALRMLAAEYGTGAWRRKQVADPSNTRLTMRETLAADERGLSLDTDGSAALVPWSAFGGKPRELHILFHERLSRSYSAEELLGIEALVRTAAIVAAVDGASEMFEPDRGARFDAGELRELGEFFDWGRTWAQQAGVSDAYEREVAASALLGRSLLDASDGAWSASVSGIERLLKNYPDSLLVRLLSNGTAAH
jgi:hypothetical protein